VVVFSLKFVSKNKKINNQNVVGGNYEDHNRKGDICRLKAPLNASYIMAKGYSAIAALVGQRTKAPSAVRNAMPFKSAT
jgi:hypothetical protein